MDIFGGFSLRAFPGQKAPMTLILPTQVSSKSSEGANLKCVVSQDAESLFHNKHSFHITHQHHFDSFVPESAKLLNLLISAGSAN